MRPARIRQRGATRGSDRGAIAMLTAILVPVLLLFCAVAIDVGNWYVQAQRAQKAADAAALAGVTYMPNNYTTASSTAIDMSADNGFPNSGSSAVSTFQTEKTSELGVTVSTTVNNAFGAIIGNPTTTIARTAIADYQGPAVMGSPCNTFGNEPNSIAANQPAGTTIPSQAQGGYATCQNRAPNFWAAIEGPATAKIQGDRYSTRTCSSSTTDYCAGGTNQEYSVNGYFYVVRVGPSVGTNPITIQLYDAAAVDTGSNCENLPSSGISNGMNPYAPDATARYARSTTGNFCPGDSDPGGSGTQNPMTTSFVMRERTLTYNPLLATVIPGCVKQFGAQVDTPMAPQLTASSGSYRPQLAKVLHQWVTLCTFTPSGAGDYYLQVRTNASTAGATPEVGTNNLIWTNGPNAYSTSETQTNGRGSNGFGIRAFVGASNSQPSALNADVSVAGWERMPIFQNVPNSTALFNLLQVKPDAAGKSFYFDLFDVGDASGTGTVTVLRPVENGTNTLPGCSSTVSGSTTNIPGNSCTATISSATNNGRVQTVVIPIPTGYTCDDTSVGGCWFRVQVTFNGASSVTDFTTWNATIGGDAVRLVR